MGWVPGFEPTAHPVEWTLDQAPQPVTAQDSKGRPLRGITAVATIDTHTLKLRQAVLSSIRVLRDYESLNKAPVQVLTATGARARRADLGP